MLCLEAKNDEIFVLTDNAKNEEMGTIRCYKRPEQGAIRLAFDLPRNIGVGRRKIKPEES